HPAGEDLRQRGRGADAVPAVGRALRSLLPRPWRQVPGSDRRDAAQGLIRFPAGPHEQKTDAGDGIGFLSVGWARSLLLAFHVDQSWWDVRSSAFRKSPRPVEVAVKQLH